MELRLLPFGRRLINVVCILRVRAKRGRAAIITVDFDGDNGDEVDGLLIMTSLCNLLLKIWIFSFDFGLASHFLTLSGVESILKFWSDEADTAIDR